MVTAERTFWEKATILHAEANRPLDGSLPLRYSRHYYDMARMAQSPIKDSALEKLDLLESVVHFKDTFFRRGWTHYDLARPGTFRLIPDDSRLTELNNDYRQMQIMIFGRIPDFSEIIDILSKL